MAKSQHLERRLAASGKDSRCLAQDVNKLEGALNLQRQLVAKDDQSVKGILRKELGGSIWQHGGQGKVLGYKSTKDLKDKYSINSGKKTKPPQQLTHGTSPSKKVIKKTPSKLNVKVKEPSPSKLESVKSDTLTIEPGVTKAPQRTKPMVKQSEDSCETQIKPNIGVGPGICGGPPDLLRGAQDASLTATRDTKDKSSEPELVNPALDIHLPLDFSPVSDSESEHLFDSDFASKSYEERNSKMRAKVLKKMITKIDSNYLEASFGKGDDLKDVISQVASENVQCDPEVYNWLKSLQLKETEKYAKVFAKNEMDIESVKLLTETQLKQMGITSIGPLNKMLFAIKDLRGDDSEIETFLGTTRSTKSSSKTKHNGNTNDSSRNPMPLDVQKSGLGPEKLVKIEEKSQKTRAPTMGKHTLEGEKTNQIAGKGASLEGYKTQQKKLDASGGQPKAMKSVRPVSGSVMIPGSKRTVTKRPASASVTAKQSGPSRRGAKSAAEKVEKENDLPTNSSALDERDLNVSDFVSVRTLMMDTPFDDSMVDTEVAHPNPTPLGIPEKEVATSNDTSVAGDRLQEIENQIILLQKELKNPLAMELIDKLQSQLHEVQREIISKKNTPLTKSTLSPKVTEKDPQKPEPVATQLPESELDNTEQSTGISQSSSVPSSRKLSGAKGSTQKPDVASLNMSKTQLLREVRKQKDEHRKHIRHLESELSRLKYKDPLRSCEIPIEDIQFDENDIIGEGAFSQVFHGYSQGSEIAVKRLKVPLTAQDKNYFAAEVSLLRELRHPRVVLLLGVNTTSQLPLMILEFMACGSLYHYLHNPKNKYLDHAAYYQIARDTALGMNYLHRHRPAVLHLDLKSMNVLLTTHLRAKIGDFGFSKLRHDAESMAKGKQLKGTPAWMSPELLDTGEISTKADVYSFGIILWEMLTRKLPYEGSSMYQVIQHARSNRRPEIPIDCPHSLRDLIMACWEHNPARRPPFQDIVGRLEKLHFPQEWRILFTVSGVPPAALDDVEATRSLINLVYDTMDGNIRPEDVPKLNLNISGEDQETPMSDVYSSDSSGSDGVTYSQHTKSSHDPKTTSRSSRLAWSEDFDTNQQSLPKPIPSNFVMPPPPPVPHLDLSSFSSKSNKNIPTRKTTSFLDDLKAGVQEIHLKQALPNISEADQPKVKSQSRKNGNGMDLRTSQLLAQKAILKTTDHPHPNQLRALEGVSEAKLHDLAEVLKKAVSERRAAMNAGDGNSMDQTLTYSGWSVLQD